MGRAQKPIIRSPLWLHHRPVPKQVLWLQSGPQLSREEAKASGNCEPQLSLLQLRRF